MSRTDSLLFPELEYGPNFDAEAKLIASGCRFVAGIDEAGRGPLAGPVVAAAVILNENDIPEGLNDSKKLTEAKRELLLEQILTTSMVAWASLPAPIIDEINIRQATLTAMTLAAKRLPVTADHFLIDGRDLPMALTNNGTALIKGDARSLSIAAASIVAKVVRDRIMVRAEALYPGYGLASHKGYGSAKHREMIHKLGPCPIHRKSFEPIKSIIHGQ